MAKLHDLICKHLLRAALEPLGTVEVEKPVAPLDEQRIDVYFELRPDPPPPGALPHLGVLRRMVEVERCALIEPYSATPTAENLDDNLRKKLNLHHGLKRAARGVVVARPLLWVLSPGRPEEALWGLSGTRDADWPSGFYRCAPQLATWIVVMAEVPKTEQTRFLRLLGPPALQLEAMREHDRLLLDDTHQRLDWLEILAEIRYLFDEPSQGGGEDDMQYEEIRARSKREFRDVVEAAWAQARANRIAAQADDILTVLEARGVAISAAVRERVLGCQDSDVLKRWLIRAAVASSDAEVVEA